jgi:hypothetical protein
VPFQRRISELTPADPSEAPTAQALVADVAATPPRPLIPDGPAGFGLGTCFQVVPFHRTSKVDSPNRWPYCPTAHARRDETTAAPLKSGPPPGLGVFTTVQPRHAVAVAGWGTAPASTAAATDAARGVPKIILTGQCAHIACLPAGDR